MEPLYKTTREIIKSFEWNPPSSHYMGGSYLRVLHRGPSLREGNGHQEDLIIPHVGEGCCWIPFVSVYTITCDGEKGKSHFICFQPVSN